jgi:poly(3-hydroxybutyrate) depolymerase
MVIATIAELKNEFPVDDRRIYIGGFSMGGCGTWDILSRYPDLFAAAFPIAGPPGDRKALAPVIKHIPIWIVHGGKDRVAPVESSRNIAGALKEAGSPVKYTEYPEMGHETSRPLAESDLRDWLFAQKRSAAPRFTPTSVPESAALVIKTLPHGTHDTWTGAVHRTGHGVPRLVIGGVAYRLKAKTGAAPAAADLLARIGKGDVTGECTVTGTVELNEQAWISVDEIRHEK